MTSSLVPSSTLLRSLSRPAGPSTLSRRSASTTTTTTTQTSVTPKRRVLILGSGWSGYQLARDLDKTKNEVTIVSPSTNFAFTPLLASVCTGALDYRSAIEPVREIKGINFLHAWVDAIDVKRQTATLVPAYPRALNEDRFAETRGGFATALVRPAHRRPVETAEADDLETIPGSGGRPLSAAAPITAGSPPSNPGAFSPTQANSAQPISSSLIRPEGTSSPTTNGHHGHTTIQDAGHNSYGPSETWKSLEESRQYKVDYDVVVVAVGSFNRTFKLKGVKNNAWFLKDIQNARSIRFRIFECLEQASALHLNDTERSRLLQWVIVGGGPTGAELAAELVDLKHDLHKQFPKLAPLIKITLLDSAPAILNAFHEKLASYARKKFARDGIDMRLGVTVKEVKKGRIVVGDEELPFSLLVWSTGICANPLVKKLIGKIEPPRVNGLGADAFEQGWGALASHDRTSQILIDDRLRALAPIKPIEQQQPAQSLAPGKKEEASVEEVELGTPSERHTKEEEPQVIPGVFAIGDAAALKSGLLPATAQVANQQAKHLAKLLNELPPPNRRKLDTDTPTAAAGSPVAPLPTSGRDVNLDRISQAAPFEFFNKGIMASLGTGSAIVQLPPIPKGSNHQGADLSGRPAWLAWRSTYSILSLSWRNKISVPLNWLMTGIFGRDISRF
ncbi:hypothetical protein OC846_003385 [Tilletia horrida]|uniref:FAD/NAD(P)-binding domain-containing protein n=1 Tax=Tilletia horrida TaxID=155126 RepID=A0AAN6GPJ4_9BASI|nr:hypothetical protein OC845_003210 [Tilletia horrida]KAK0551145.1 hypothetical protein OC846_003385 [Tilletia horrida]KAK0566122.1 hypothetical protein OC861_003416 [Tilletia horrida]